MEHETTNKKPKREIKGIWVLLFFLLALFGVMVLHKVTSF